MMHLDFTSPETLKKMAALPYYGWAESLIRYVDPLWHAPDEGPYRFKVVMASGEEADECPRCGCDCGNYSAPIVTKSEWIEAIDEDEARETAERDNSGWFVTGVLPPKFPSAEVPDEYLAWFGRLNR